MNLSPASATSAKIPAATAAPLAVGGAGSPPLSATAETSAATAAPPAHSFSPCLDGKGNVYIWVMGADSVWNRARLPGVYKTDIFGGVYPPSYAFMQEATRRGINDYTQENAVCDAIAIADISTTRKMAWFAKHSYYSYLAAVEATRATNPPAAAPAAAATFAVATDEAGDEAGEEDGEEEYGEDNGNHYDRNTCRFPKYPCPWTAGFCSNCCPDA